MPVIVPQLSSLKYMDTITGGLLDGALLCLFQNDYTPIHTSTVGDFIEATFDGYARIALSGWSPAALDANNKASSELGYQGFTKTGNITANDIYGIYVITPAGALLYAERFQTTPFTLAVAGQVLFYRPRFTDQSEF